jgi:hypothetical protein
MTQLASCTLLVSAVYVSVLVLLCGKSAVFVLCVYVSSATMMNAGPTSGMAKWGEPSITCTSKDKTSSLRPLCVGCHWHTTLGRITDGCVYSLPGLCSANKHASAAPKPYWGRSLARECWALPTTSTALPQPSPAQPRPGWNFSIIAASACTLASVASSCILCPQCTHCATQSAPAHLTRSIGAPPRTFMPMKKSAVPSGAITP